MKGIICYYSGSGNTKLAITYLKNRISEVNFELCDIVKNDTPDFEAYDVVGLATFTDFWGVPQLLHSFVENLKQQTGKPAFVFNTYGLLSGKTIKQFAQIVKARGFNIISGYSLHTPESYPPMRVKGNDFDDAPNEKELKAFDDYIDLLESQCRIIANGQRLSNEKIKPGFWGSVLPVFSRNKAKKDFGEQKCNTDVCTKCKSCAKDCPYNAIEMNPFPVFDHVQCFGCWACYNHCPVQAIYTKKFQGEGQYPKPSEQMLTKMAR